ncbi:VanZ family protein [Fictibacillus norfolkensis]|jgi:glycopeptide antibiotics resistance protein|uniref:VanZ family protein n=1 Tax=Fictibacillus norfolkensis TaxID=2762233 RepID=A0ABR8SPD6_9BACL|nr:VanZ family protein [Fictibacillus norfolkensis]MBD7965346.1 VanZ family protein [Fictibacillus norfolkensis]
MKKVRFIFSILGTLVFIVYMAVLIKATLFSFNEYAYGKSANLVLFDSIRLMWRSEDDWLILKNIIGNVLLFVPFGLLLPLIYRVFNSWRFIFIFGFGTSFIIEVLQYEYFKRIFDIDDIFLNGMGAMLGLFLYKFLAMIFRWIERLLR